MTISSGDSCHAVVYSTRRPRQNAMSRSTTVSCPGKVLIAGGYLVLEPENGGLVVATASRFYTVVRDAEEPVASPSSTLPSSSKDIRIKVNSPQFVEATWIYSVRIEHSNSFDLGQVQDGWVVLHAIAYTRRS